MSDIYQELNMTNRDDAVMFLKSLICEKPQPMLCILWKIRFSS